MSNILKKITKKYKWLRFLNYKTTKLAVLSAALFGLCLSSGHSFAKYRDENYGNGNAGVATLGDIYVHQNYETFKLPETMNETNLGTYVIVAEFNIIFSNFEVKANYSFSLEIGGQKSTADNIEAIDHSYFHSNSIENKTKFFAFKNENDGNLVTTDVCSYVTDDKISKFENNKYYYLKGSATMENNDVSTISKTYEENCVLYAKLFVASSCCWWGSG